MMRFLIKIEIVKRIGFRKVIETVRNVKLRDLEKNLLEELSAAFF